VALIEPFAPEAGRRGQQPFGVEVLLRIHFMQQWLNLSDPAMQEALHDVPVFRDFAGLSNWGNALPSVSRSALAYTATNSTISSSVGLK